MSGGESTSITISDSTSVKTLPVTSGRKLSSAWTSPRSELARGHDLAGGQLVVAGEVESLQPLEDRGAQVVLHVEREAAADEAADERQHEVDDARGTTSSDEQRPEGRWSRRRSRCR